MADREERAPLRRVLDTCELEIRAEDSAPPTLKMSASSERVVERWFGNEKLSHDPKAVRLDRIRAGAAPLLFNHNWDDPVGMITTGRVENKRLVVEATLFETDRAKEVAAMIRGGLKNVSIGYEINDHLEERDGNNVNVTATDWEPYEVSIVSIPADPGVGVGRSKFKATEPEAQTRATAVATPNSAVAAVPQPQEGIMSETITAAAGASAERKITAVDAEKERRQAISDLAKANRIDSRVETRWIEDGTPLPQVANEILSVIEERGKARPAIAAELGLSRKETQRYSLFRAIRALKFGAQEARFKEEAAFEIECSREVAKKLGRQLSTSILIPAEVLQRPVGADAAQRAMATTPGSKGGYLVNVENMGFIDILRNRSVSMNMGARVLSGLQGNVVFPRQTGKASVTWQGGEGATVTASDQTLGQLSMTPKTAIAITDVSEQLLQQSSPSAEAFVMADLARDVAIDGVDSAVINGTGGAQPLGIKNTTGVTTGQDAATATYAKVLAFVSTAAGANAIRGNPGWVTNAAGAAVLMQKQRFTSTDTPLWDGNILDGSLIGFRAMSSEQLAASNLIFGSWDEVVIGEWGVLELAMDNGGTRFNAAQVGIRAMWMVDVLVRYPQAFVVSTNLSA